MSMNLQYYLVDISRNTYICQCKCASHVYHSKEREERERERAIRCKHEYFFLRHELSISHRQINNFLFPTNTYTIPLCSDICTYTYVCIHKTDIKRLYVGVIFRQSLHLYVFLCMENKLKYY